MGNINSVHLIRWANYFAEREWKVDIITWYRTPENVLKLHPSIKIHAIHFPPHQFFRYGALLETIFLVKKIQPTIIHAHYVSVFGILAAMYGKLFNFKPIIQTVWGSDILEDMDTPRRPLIKYALLKADLITTDAEFMKDIVCKLGVNSDKIKIILFGTDVKKFSPQQRNEKLRIELGLENSLGIISLRSFQQIYDIESLIRAVPLVVHEIPHAKFLICGSGPLEKDLKELSKSLNLSDKIQFLGSIPNDLIPEYLASLDLYVSTSLSDAGLAASTAEAMASGLPVVITDFGANSQWVQDGNSGFLVPLKNPDKLAESIVKALNNKELLTIFGERNRKIIEDRNNYYVEMEKMEKLYFELQKMRGIV